VIESPIIEDYVARGIQRTLLLQLRVRFGEVADDEREMTSEVWSLRSLDLLAIKIIEAHSKGDFLRTLFDVPNE
jgi:hypothetical protein